jgi:hypothetical protein
MKKLILKDCVKVEKKYHIVFDSKTDIASLVFILNECDLICANKDEVEKINKRKLKGVKIVYK